MQKNIDYILFILLLAFSTFEFFFRNNILIFLLYAFSFIFFLIKKKKYNHQHILIIFIFFILLYIFQLLTIERFKITFFIANVINLFGVFFIGVLINNRFVKIFINTIYWIALISLLFYFTSYIPSIKSFFMNVICPHFVSLNVNDAIVEGGGNNIIIYNYLNGFVDENGLMRNSGPFWEPGMFAVFICMALFFHNVFEKSNLMFCNIVLIITLITTLSTGGYVAGTFVLFSYLLKKGGKSNIFATLIGLGFLLLLWNMFSSSGYVGEKIKFQMEVAELGSDYSRFGAILTQLSMIKNSPFIGGEELSKYVYTETGTLASGTLIPFVNLGIPGGIIFYLILLKSSLKLSLSYNKNKISGLLLLFLIVILSISQTILFNSVFLTIIFIGLTKLKVRTHE